jgi:hypothetical protein
MLRLFNKYGLAFRIEERLSSREYQEFLGALEKFLSQKDIPNTWFVDRMRDELFQWTKSIDYNRQSRINWSLKTGESTLTNFSNIFSPKPQEPYLTVNYWSTHCELTVKITSPPLVEIPF